MVMMPEREQTNGSYKNIFAHANEEECPQKRGDKEWYLLVQELSDWQNAKYKRKKGRKFFGFYLESL